MSNINFEVVLYSARTILQYVKNITQNSALDRHIKWFNDVIDNLNFYKEHPESTKKLIIKYIDLINGDYIVRPGVIYNALANMNQVTNIHNINNIVVDSWIQFLIGQYKDLSSSTDTSHSEDKETESITRMEYLVLDDSPEGTRSPTKIQHLILGNNPAKDKPTASILRVVAIVLLVIVAVLGIIFGIGMIIAFIYAIRSEEREEKWSTQRVLGRTLLSFGYVAMYWSKYGIW